MCYYYRSYSSTSCHADSTPEVLRHCSALLQSEFFFLTLSNLTGLSLHPAALASSDSDDVSDEEDGGGSNKRQKLSEDSTQKKKGIVKVNC